MSKFMNVLISVLFLVSCSNNSSKESGYTSSGDIAKENIMLKDYLGWTFAKNQISKIRFEKYYSDTPINSINEVYYSSDSVDIDNLYEILSFTLKEDSNKNQVPGQLELIYYYYVGNDVYTCNFSNNRYFDDDTYLLEGDLVFSLTKPNMKCYSLVNAEESFDIYKLEGDLDKPVFTNQKYYDFDALEFVEYNKEITDHLTYQLIGKNIVINVINETIFEIDNKYYQLINDQKLYLDITHID